MRNAQVGVAARKMSTPETEQGQLLIQPHRAQPRESDARTGLAPHHRLHKNLADGRWVKQLLTIRS
jgi:hypothetical protein